jgi:hypothetical protein
MTEATEPLHVEPSPEEIFKANIDARYTIDEMHIEYKRKRKTMDRLDFGHLNLTLAPLIASLVIAGALKSENTEAYYEEISIAGGVAGSLFSCFGVAVVHSRKLRKARNIAVNGAKIVEERRINPTPNWITEGVALVDWSEKEIPRAT